MNILQPKLLQQIYVIEARVMEWARSSGACALTPECECAPADSALNYLFPGTARTAGSPPDTQLLFGTFGYDINQAHAGLRCGAALTEPELRGVLLWLKERGIDAFFDDGFTASSAVRPRARYLKTTVFLDMDVWARMEVRSAGLGLTSILDSGHDTDVRLYSDLLATNYKLRALQLEEWVLNDVILLVVAVVLILGYMVIYFNSVAFALAAVLQIVISFPIMFVVVDVVLQQRPISIFACTSLWVVTGVSADNIFVVHETWRSAKLLRVDGEQAPVARRLHWTLSQSARPLIVADGTTAFALFVNCVSPITGVFQFGLCGGVLILANFFLVLVYTPALLVLEEKGRFAWGCNLRLRELSLRSLHSLHATLYIWRRPLLLAFVAIAAAFAPYAASLTSQREGEPFLIFSEFSELPPSDIDWGSGRGFTQSDAAPLGEAELRGTTASRVLPSHFARLLRGESLRPPPVDLALWPGSAGWSVALLFLDGLLFVGFAWSCATGKSLGFMRVPSVLQRSSRAVNSVVAAVSLLASAAAVGTAIWVWVLAATDSTSLSLSYGCGFAQAANGWLAGMLIAHAILFFAAAAIYASDKLMLWYRGVLLMQQRQRRRIFAASFGILAAICLAGAITVIILSSPGGESSVASDNSEASSAPTDRDGRGGGGSPWRVRTWQGVGLPVALLYWSVALVGYGLLLPDDATAATRSTRPTTRKELWSVGAVLHVAGWALFVLCGFASASPSDAATRVLLGVCLFVSTLLHIVRAAALPPSATHRRDVGAHGCMATLCALLALLALRSSVESPMSGHGIALGLVMLADAGCGIAVCYVVSSGSPLGMLRPIEPPSPSGQEGLSRASAAILLLSGAVAITAASSGWATLGMAASERTITTVYGTTGAARALGWLLVGHSPMALLCSYLQLSGRSLGMLQPTAWSSSRHSRAAAALIGVLGAALLISGVLVLVTISDTPAASAATALAPSSPPPRAASAPGDGSDAGVDALSLLLGLVLTLDSLVCLLGGWWSARSAAPNPGMQRRYRQAAAGFGSSAAALLGGAIFFFVACASPALARTVWRTRALPVSYEIVIACHAALTAGWAAFSRGPKRVYAALVFTLLTLAAFLPAAVRGEPYETLAALQLCFALPAGPIVHVAYGDAVRVASGRAPFAALEPRFLLLAAVLLSAVWAGTAMCYLRAVLGPALAPSSAAQVVGSVLLAHWPLFSAWAHTWYTGRPTAGFEPSDAPAEPRVRVRSAGLLLLAALSCATAGSGLLLLGAKGSLGDGATGGAKLPVEAPVGTSELCYLVHGLEGQRHRGADFGELRWTSSSGDVYSANVLDRFNPAAAASQLAYVHMCDSLLLGGSPANSNAKPICLIRELRDWIARNASPPAYRVWPVPEVDFLPALELLLHAVPPLAGYVGYTNSSRTRIAWLLMRVRSKYEVRSGAMLGQPDAMQFYISSWKQWYESLRPPRTLTAAAGQTMTGQSAVATGGDSVLAAGWDAMLSTGWPSCRSWEMYPTLQVFLEGVIRSLVLTPLFCVGAVFAVVRRTKPSTARHATPSQQMTAAMHHLSTTSAPPQHYHSTTSAPPQHHLTFSILQSSGRRRMYLRVR